jgi:hypothetical protein
VHSQNSLCAGHIMVSHPTKVLSNLLQAQCLHSSMMNNFASDFTICFYSYWSLNRTRNFDAHDPYHPYDAYFNLDLHRSVGRDGKDRKGGVV